MNGYTETVPPVTPESIREAIAAQMRARAAIVRSLRKSDRVARLIVAETLEEIERASGGDSR